MRSALLLSVLLAPSAARAAAAEAARAVEVVRPRVERTPARPILPVPAVPRARPLSSPAELRRLRADLSGRVTARAVSEARRIRGRYKGEEARVRLSEYVDVLRREELELRRDRARAFEEHLAAPAGSPERKAWWTAAQAGSVMLEDYASAYFALSAAPERRPRAAATSPRGG